MSKVRPGIEIILKRWILIKYEIERDNELKRDNKKKLRNERSGPEKQLIVNLLENGWKIEWKGN